MIDFNQPYIAPNQEKYIKEALKNYHISGDGPFTKKCNLFLEKYFGVKKALITTSCTHALEMSAILLNLKEGDEVIVPSFTFVSTPNSFILRGAKPVFIDIRPDTLNMDENKLEELITDNTKAIYLVHYAGVGCEMDKILEIAQKYGLDVVEDNAHGLFSKYKGKYLGTIGKFATQSFHETKNISCGEGGALLINDTSYSQIDKYSWVDVGSSFLPSDILAAILLSHLEESKNIQRKRKEIWDTYDHALKKWAHNNKVMQPFVPDYCEQSYHMYYLLLPNLDTRQKFIQHLKNNGIHSVFHYVPLHTSEMGKKYGHIEGSLPVTEDISNRLVRLPMYFDLTSKDLEKINQAVINFKFD